MTDSLFTTKNNFDDGVLTLGATPTIMATEACTRRLVKLKGAHAAAGELYRLADVCAAAEIQPIEHWRNQVDASANPPALTSSNGIWEALPPVHRNPWFWSTIGLAALAVSRPLFGF